MESLERELIRIREEVGARDQVINSLTFEKQHLVDSVKELMETRDEIEAGVHEVVKENEYLMQELNSVRTYINRSP